jgi:hypothetical protein
MRWRQALGSSQAYTSAFSGIHHLDAASKLLTHLYLWCQPFFHSQHIDKLQTYHPWVIILKGPHGSGKSALLSFLLSQLLGLDPWFEHDVSDSLSTNIVAQLMNWTNLKSDVADELSLHVLENAETITGRQPAAELVSMVQAMTAAVLDSKAVPSRLVVVTASLAPQWIRSLL